MSNEKLIAALPLAALFVAVLNGMPARAAGQDGMVAVRDRETGQMRAPTAAELRALAPKPKAGLQARPKPALVTRSDGTRQVRIGEQGLVYSVVSRDPSGKLASACVHGQQAANAAVQSGVHEEHNHETR